MKALLEVLNVLLTVYSVILLLRVLSTWIRLDPYTNPWVRFLYAVTDPVLDPIRSVLPQTGFVDFSPMVVFILIIALQGVLSILSASL